MNTNNESRVFLSRTILLYNLLNTLENKKNLKIVLDKKQKKRHNKNVLLRGYNK